MFESKLISSLRKTLKNFLLIVIGGFGITFLFTPLPVQAQEVNFTQCQFSEGSGENAVQNCLGQIFQFTFVVGMFIIAIRVAIFALNNYNPVENGKAVNESINIVWESTLGFLLLGMPILFIGIFNPASLNFSFLQIGNIVNNTASRNNENKANSGTTPKQDTSSSINQNGKKTTAEQTKEANKKLVSYLTPQNNYATLFGAITANAQEELTLDEAVQIITNVLRAEVECQKLFITQEDFSNCKALEESDFVEARNGITARNRQLYTPLLEIGRVFSGNLVTIRQLTVDDFAVDTSSTDKTGCRLAYASILDVQANNKYLISAEYCLGAEFNSIFFETKNSQLTPRVGQVIEKGSEVIQQGKLTVHYKYV